MDAIGIVGAGAMGRGIAQIAAQGGISVTLVDANPAACAAAMQTLSSTWDQLVAKGRMGSADASAAAARVHAAAEVSALAQCDAVIEAIVERLEAKQALFAQLESVVRADCVLATNTSSLSVTALAAGLARPDRFAGFHFFNPVPLMKVVEVIAGLHTAPGTCTLLHALAQRMGHTAVQAADTPGFIVNHLGRGYGTEALALVREGVADFATIDRILRDQAQFKLGPFELMDLTALDVSHPVMESIYRQYFDEPRYRPSVITAQRLAGGMLGKKVGQGFYNYTDGKLISPQESAVPVLSQLPPVWVSPRAARAASLLQLLKTAGAQIETGQNPSASALCLVAPLGLDVTTTAVLERLDPTRVVGVDMLLDDAATQRRVLATNPATRADMCDAAHALLAHDGKAVSVIRDSAGFVTQRVLAHIVNIGADMCQQAICSPQDLDTAVRLGLGYPKGPLAWGDALGPGNMLEVLVNMHTVYNDPRYRASPWLRRRAALGLSLSHQELA